MSPNTIVLRRAFYVLWLAVIAASAPGCATTAMSSSRGADALDPTEVETMTASAMASVERWHWFASDPAWLETWRRRATALRQQLGAIGSRSALHRWLAALESSLGDVHLAYAPAGDEGETLGLPFRVVPEHGENGVQLRVTRSALSAAPEGSRLVAIDGRDVVQLLADGEPFVAARPELARLEALARHITRRSRTLWPELAGQRAHVELTRRDGTVVREVTHWAELPSEPASPREDLDLGFTLSRVPCSGGPDPAYGHGYALAYPGHGLCIYETNEPPYDALPIVRWYAFEYRGRGEAQDTTARLAADLSAVRMAARDRRGVIVDVRENGGGINPYVFLELLARGPYRPLGTSLRAAPELVGTSRLEEALWQTRARETYAATVTQHPPGATFSFPYFGVDGAHPLEGIRSAPAPIPIPSVVLVGPGCASACDVFAHAYVENTLGPVVGEPSMSAMTIHRLPIALMTRSGERLGTFSVALGATLGLDGRPLEGEPLAVTHPLFRTRSNWDDYDRLLVERAEEALATRRVSAP